VQGKKQTILPQIMYNANKTTASRFATFCKNVLISLSLSAVLFSCQKEACLPQQQPAMATKVSSSSQSPLLQASTRNLQLLQVNADRTAISLNWGAFQAGSEETQDYRIEAAMAGSRFTDWVEIASTSQLSIDIKAKDFNRQIRKLFVTGMAEDIILRVKYNKPNAAPAFSSGALLQVTTYHPTIEYDNANVFRIPGNFQNWKVDSAQKIISPKNDGEYEGYVNFTNPNSQFLMVKSDQAWRVLATYYYIGANKFGFGGTVFSVAGGAGIYKFNASTETRAWSCTKINSWNVHGTAITDDGKTDVDMLFNASNNTWEITGNFKNGSFIFRANKNNEIVFGHNATSEAGVPNYNGAKIEIAKTGNYTITLSLLSAGNYSYGIQRNN
jgi:hypothetical protein